MIVRRVCWPPECSAGGESPGTGACGFGGSGGPAANASICSPSGVAVDASGNLFVADYGNGRIRRVDAATQVITTVVGKGTVGFSGDGGPASNAELFSPFGVAVDNTGSLFIADGNNSRIRRVDAAIQIIAAVAGTGTVGFSGARPPAPRR